MTGLPASGKSTLARKLAADAGGRIRRVDLDDLRTNAPPSPSRTPYGVRCELDKLAFFEPMPTFRTKTLTQER
ncbi:AAA family ATPase [Streptomyces montanus]|nr:AAA family ATPase [Streptomyces montanus]